MTNNHPDLDDVLALLDSESYQETRKRELYHQPLDERIRNYLKSCTQRGHSYQPGYDCNPTIKQLAAYLACDPTTLVKLKSGQRKQINFESITRKGKGNILHYDYIVRLCDVTIYVIRLSTSKHI